MSRQSIREAIEQAFGEFAEIDSFVKEVREIRFPKGKVIYIPGDMSQSLYIVIKGLVSISRVTPNGRGVILDYVSIHQFFGEEVLSGKEEIEGRWEVAETKQETVLAVVDKSLIIEHLFPNPHIMQKIMRVNLAKRQRFAARLEILLHREVRVRLAALLLDLGRNYGVIQKDGTLLIDLIVPHHELARFIGATRETVSATVSSFKTAGYVDNRGRKLLILKPVLLESLL
ncbi:Crp/Fnr family transcriptional regulator [Myxococcota bacterium]|nr:Crp/Fnr family transcriptional regulator [Myxococcota bacterium]MBU1537117.1 Crp/Fnr family transcriptional regulator [Myxococcota bacterium]